MFDASAIRPLRSYKFFSSKLKNMIKTSAVQCEEDTREDFNLHFMGRLISYSWDLDWGEVRIISLVDSTDDEMKEAAEYIEKLIEKW